MNINGANYKVQNQRCSVTQFFSKASNSKKDNFNPDDWANTNGMKGMYIGGGTKWKKMLMFQMKQKLI